MVHGQQDPTVAHSSTPGGGCALKVQKVPHGDAWQVMTLLRRSHMHILPSYFAVAMLLVTAAVTLFAQLSRRSRQDRSRRELPQRFKIARYREYNYRLTRHRKLCEHLAA